MPTTKPRIQLTLPEDTYLALKDYSRVSGQSMSGFTAQVLIEATPNIKLLTRIIEQGKNLQEEAFNTLVNPLQLEEERLTEALKTSKNTLEVISGVSSGIGGEKCEENPLLLTRGSGLTKLGKKSKKTTKKLWLAASRKGEND